MKTCDPLLTPLCLRRASLALGFAGLLLGQGSASAADVIWNSSTAGALWSAPGNWSGGTPSGNNLFFSSAGRTPDATTVGNVVDQNITANSLTYQGIASWQVTGINSGVTLNVSGATGNILDVSYGGNAIARAAVRGAGKLTINQSNATIQVTGRDLNHGGYYALLDLSGLATFEAVVDKVLVGNALTSQFYEGRLSLAQNTTITASSFLIGEVGANTQSSTRQVGTVTLGTTNILNVDRLDVGSERGWGTLHFASGAQDASLTLRGKASTDLAPVRGLLNVGITGNGSATAANGNYGGVADLRGGAVDAYLQSLNLGVMSANTGVSVKGEFWMDEGSVDATTLMIGWKSAPGANASGTAHGVFDIGGGSLAAEQIDLASQGAQGSAVGELRIHGSGEVEVTQAGILMGNNGSTSATVSLKDSGKLTVAGDIAKGLGTTSATLSVEGGTLEMNGHAIRVDTFVASAGVLRNLGQVNAGAAWSKTGVGLLRLEGSNTYTGSLLVAGGTVLLDGSLSQANVTVAADAAFSMSEAAVLEFNLTSSTSDLFTVQSGGAAAFEGNFVFNLGLALEERSWNLFSGTVEADYAGFNGIQLAGALSGVLLDQGGGLWRYETPEWMASFNAGSGEFSLVAVPEPSALAFGALAFGSLAFLRRNRRKP